MVYFLIDCQVNAAMIRLLGIMTVDCRNLMYNSYCVTGVNQMAVSHLS
jgi:hypothetical protein